MRASEARELRKFWHFYILKLQFLSIFCRYIRYSVGTNDMLVGLHVPTNFQMYRLKSEKALSVAPPPPGYTNAKQQIGQVLMNWSKIIILLIQLIFLSIPVNYPDFSFYRFRFLSFHFVFEFLPTFCPNSFRILPEFLASRFLFVGGGGGGGEGALTPTPPPPTPIANHFAVAHWQVADVGDTAKWRKPNFRVRMIFRDNRVWSLPIFQSWLLRFYVWHFQLFLLYVRLKFLL